MYDMPPAPVFDPEATPPAAPPRLTRAEVEQMPYLSAPQAANFAGNSRDTWLRWAKLGLVPSIRIGGRVFFPVKPLLAMLDGATVDPAAQVERTG